MTASFAGYLRLDRDSESKHEFDAGEILAMPGGTARHSALAATIIAALGTTRASGSTVFQSDLRVRVAATGAGPRRRYSPMIFTITRLSRRPSNSP